MWDISIFSNARTQGTDGQTTLRMPKRQVLVRLLIVGTAIVLAGSLLLLPILHAEEPTMLSYLFRIFSVVGKQWILHGVDHKKIAEELRMFAHQHRWDLPATDRPAVTIVWSESVTFPERLKALKASSIQISDECVKLEFGGTPLHYGIAVFREGNRGSGVKKLGDGVWFYSEDGRG